MIPLIRLPSRTLKSLSIAWSNPHSSKVKHPSKCRRFSVTPENLSPPPFLVYFLSPVGPVSALFCRKLRKSASIRHLVLWLAELSGMREAITQKDRVNAKFAAIRETKCRSARGIHTERRQSSNGTGAIKGETRTPVLLRLATGCSFPKMELNSHLEISDYVCESRPCTMLLSSRDGQAFPQVRVLSCRRTGRRVAVAIGRRSDRLASGKHSKCLWSQCLPG